MNRQADLWHVVVGIDPSAAAGWCILGVRVGGTRWEYLGSGQCDVGEVWSEVVSALPPRCTVRILAVEGIFKGPPRQGKVQPPVYWRMGWNGGRIVGRLEAQPVFARAELWVPEPRLWRSAIGVKQGRRDAVAHRMLIWARDAVGEEMEGPRGGSQVDRAMAVGIAHAAAKRVRW